MPQSVACPGVASHQLDRHLALVESTKLLRGGHAEEANSTTNGAANAAQAAIVSFTFSTSCLSVNGLAKKSNLPSVGRCFWNASSA